MSFQDLPVNSKMMPKDFPRQFDAHVYFTEETRLDAIRFRDLMRTTFADQTVFVGELIDRPIGPHLQPMWEANFPKELFTDIVLWLMHNRGNLTVLVHELSGDDLWDHTVGALFLGAPAPLTLDIFSK